MFFSFELVAQNQMIDSLRVLYQASKDSSEKIDLKCEISQRYTEIGEFELAEKLANEALDQASKTQYDKGVGLAYYSLARLNQYLGDLNKAIIHHQEAFHIFKSKELFEELAWTSLNMGITFLGQKDKKKAIEYDKKALDYFIK